MITSKLTSKSQTVIPQAIREHLRVGPGDALVYELLEGGAVVIRPLRRERTEDPFALFHEWSSEADEEAFGGL